MKKSRIIKIVILAIALILLLNPSIFPIPEGTLGAIRAQIQNHISSVLVGRTGFFSPATLIPAAAVIVICWLTGAICGLILDCITAKKARTRTVVGLTASLVKYSCVLIGIIWTLNVLGVNLAAIFASLGVLTLIIGFGAQSLIEDMVTGIFIIFEGNYNVDDVIVLDEFRGTVTKIGIRTTTIEDSGGNVKIINNSDIRNIQNRSQNLSLAICDLGISYESDIRQVEKIIIPKLPELYNEKNKLFKKAPRYMGVQEFGSSEIVLRFCVDCDENDFFPATRLLNREILILFNDNNIDIPYSKLEVITSK